MVLFVRELLAYHPARQYGVKLLREKNRVVVSVIDGSNRCFAC